MDHSLEFHKDRAHYERSGRLEMATGTKTSLNMTPEFKAMEVTVLKEQALGIGTEHHTGQGTFIKAVRTVNYDIRKIVIPNESKIFRRRIPHHIFLLALRFSHIGTCGRAPDIQEIQIKFVLCPLAAVKWIQ